jgi:hypothetical protein
VCHEIESVNLLIDDVADVNVKEILVEVNIIIIITDYNIMHFTTIVTRHHRCGAASYISDE